MCQDKVQGHELANDGVPFGLAPVTVVLFSQRGIQRSRAQMKHPSLPSVGAGADVTACHDAVQEPHRGEAMRTAGECQELAPEEVATVQRNQR
jgi:hypothetical protein